MADAAVRRIQREEQIPAGGLWTRLSDVFQDGVAHLTLQWVFLYAPALGVVHRERLQPPVEVAQKQARYLTATQSINRQEQQGGFSAQGGGTVPRYPFEQLLYLLPLRSFG